MTTRAVVLGGGGPVGIAWESGLIFGLAEGGVNLGEANTFIGTSAGSVVGAQLALGRTPQEIGEPHLRGNAGGRSAAAASQNAASQGEQPVLSPLMELRLRGGDANQDPNALMRRIGEFALAAQTITEEQFIGSMGYLISKAESWPKGYICTAVDTADGSFMAWKGQDGVTLGAAVASSCSVPGVYPPITIGGRRYMDGGMRSGTNADLASGHDRVLVLSVTLGVSRGEGPQAEMAELTRKRLEGEISGLREGGSQVELVSPDEGSAEAFGINFMDFTRRAGAAAEGQRQGRELAERLRAFWGAELMAVRR